MTTGVIKEERIQRQIEKSFSRIEAEDAEQEAEKRFNKGIEKLAENLTDEEPEPEPAQPQPKKKYSLDDPAPELLKDPEGFWQYMKDTEAERTARDRAASLGALRESNKDAELLTGLLGKLVQANDSEAKKQMEADIERSKKEAEGAAIERSRQDHPADWNDPTLVALKRFARALRGSEAK